MTIKATEQPLCCRKDCDERPVMCATHFEEAMRPNDAEQSKDAETVEEVADAMSEADAMTKWEADGLTRKDLEELAAIAVRVLRPAKQAQGPVSKGKFIAIGELKMARIQVGNLPVCNEVPLIASAIDCALEALEGKALCSKCDTFTEVPS